MISLEIYNFNDFRSFLRECANSYKEHEENWSLSKWAKKLGLHGTASLTMVLNGKRSPGIAMRNQFHDFFHFDADRRRYFNLLVELPRAKGKRLERIQTELLKIKRDSITKVLSEDIFKTISYWGCALIYELIAHPTFINSPKWIRSKLMFNLEENEIKECIENLINSGLVFKTENNKLERRHIQIDTPKDIANRAVQNFQTKILALAQTAVL